ncbi:MAG: hypothetical protein JXQ71_04960 [Verrucomicrobia bacterium]|nr:hypothetical protein [Verrucomicrobiota bacterium]
MFHVPDCGLPRPPPRVAWQTDRRYAGGEDFLVSIYFETLTGDPAQARDEAVILAWLRYFLQTYGSHPRLLRVEGRPMVFIWAASAAPTDLWKRVFSALRGEGGTGQIEFAWDAGPA